MEIKVTFYDNDHYYEVFVIKGILTNRACVSKSKEVFENPAQTLKVLEVKTLRWQDAVDTWLVKLKGYFSKRGYKERTKFYSLHVKNKNHYFRQSHQLQKENISNFENSYKKICFEPLTKEEREKIDKY